MHSDPHQKPNRHVHKSHIHTHTHTLHLGISATQMRNIITVEQLEVNMLSQIELSQEFVMYLRTKFSYVVSCNSCWLSLWLYCLFLFTLVVIAF